MTSISEGQPGAPGGLMERDRTIAGPRFNRWLVPPAALCIHLCIGMAYGFSVFWLPMSHMVAGGDSAACQAQGFFAALTTTSCNWSVPAETHVFETFIAVLGISAAIWGGWLEHAGPRKAGFIAAICWGGGLVLGGIGVSLHQLWLFYLGCGLLGGIGQGLGYITPGLHADQVVPGPPRPGHRLRHHGLWRRRDDRRPARRLADGALRHRTAMPNAAMALIVLGIVYFVVMSIGAFGFRVPPVGWLPGGLDAAEERRAQR